MQCLHDGMLAEFLQAVLVAVTPIFGFLLPGGCEPSGRHFTPAHFRDQSAERKKASAGSLPPDLVKLCEDTNNRQLLWGFNGRTQELGTPIWCQWPLDAMKPTITFIQVQMLSSSNLLLSSLVDLGPAFVG